MPLTDNRMLIVYDGLCPFCASYVHLMALRKSVGKVELIDARSGHPEVLRLKSLGYDLNEGMAAIYGGRIYYGSDATVLISTMTEVNTVVGRLIAATLRSPSRARLIYPFLKVGRRAALAMLRRPAL